MPKFEHRETVTITKRPRKKRKKGKSPNSAKVRKAHGMRPSRVIKQVTPSEREHTEQLMNTDLPALAEASSIPIDTLKRMAKNNPILFIRLADSFKHQIKPTLQ